MRAAVRLAGACREVELSVRTGRRLGQAEAVRADGRLGAQRGESAHKLTLAERELGVAVCREARFSDLPRSQIVSRLTDEGMRFSSESTFHGLWRAQSE